MNDHVAAPSRTAAESAARRAAEARQLYDLIADRYDGMYTGRYERAEELALARLIRRIAEPPLLDVGCGTGLLLDLWRPARPADYIGIDVSARMVEHARAKHPGHNFMVGDACTLGGRYASAVALFGVASYVGLREMEALLRRWRCRSWLVMFCAPEYCPRYDDPRVLCRPSPVEVREVLGGQVFTFSEPSWRWLPARLQAWRQQRRSDRAPDSAGRRYVVAWASGSRQAGMSSTRPSSGSRTSIGTAMKS